MTAFRSVYADLHEIRTLAPSVKMIALTATATEETKKTIIDVPRLRNVCEVADSPNKGNVTYVVTYMPNDSDVQDYFNWIVEEVKQGKKEKTIVYCQTIKQCSFIYATLKYMLGHCMYEKGSKSPVLEMLHSCTPDDNKEAVLESFRKEDGPILLLVATIAFGMGVDCTGVHRTIHFGPSKNVEAFIQETGRAGRDGKASFSYLLYKGLMLNHVERDIKEYLKTKECRRKTLLKHFGSGNFTISGPLHTCCDNCAKRCDCSSAECSTYTLFIISDKENLDSSLQEKRKVKDSEKKQLKDLLTKYHKSLVMELLRKSAFGHVKSLTNLSSLLGFSELQIEQVVINCETLFCLEDVLRSIEIWDMRHAKKILDVLSDVFGDIDSSVLNMLDNTGVESDDECDDDELLGEWAALAEDEELLNKLTNSFSFSEMDSTYQDAAQKSLDCSDVSPVALASLKNVNVG